MGTYRFHATTAAGVPLRGVTVGHLRTYCPCGLGFIKFGQTDPTGNLIRNTSLTKDNHNFVARYTPPGGAVITQDNWGTPFGASNYWSVEFQF